MGKNGNTPPHTWTAFTAKKSAKPQPGTPGEASSRREAAIYTIPAVMCIW